MSWATNLVIDTGNGEQLVRRPQPYDAVGAALRDTFATFATPPDDMLRLLRRLDTPLGR